MYKRPGISKAHARPRRATERSQTSQALRCWTEEDEQPTQAQPHRTHCFMDLDVSRETNSSLRPRPPTATRGYTTQPNAWVHHPTQCVERPPNPMRGYTTQPNAWIHHPTQRVDTPPNPTRGYTTQPNAWIHHPTQRVETPPNPTRVQHRVETLTVQPSAPCHHLLIPLTPPPIARQNVGWKSAPWNLHRVRISRGTNTDTDTDTDTGVIHCTGLHFQLVNVRLGVMDGNTLVSTHANTMATPGNTMATTDHVDLSHSSSRNKLTQPGVCVKLCPG